MSDAETEGRRSLPVATMGQVAETSGLIQLLDRMGEGIPVRPEFSPNGIEKVVLATIRIMTYIRGLKKTGWNKDAKYAFAEWAVLATKLQDALVQENLLISQREINRVLKGKILMIHYQYDVYYSTGDQETSQWIINIASNTGACRYEFKSGSTDDKAPNKAQTAGMKHNIITLFKVPTDVDDIERDDIEPGQTGADRGGGGDERSADRSDNRDERSGERSNNRDEQRGGERGDNRDSRNDDRSSARGEAAPFGEEDTRREPDPDRDYRENVRAIGESLKKAADREAADQIWIDNSSLINRMADATYEWLRGIYETRWNQKPPQTNAA